MEMLNMKQLEYLCKLVGVSGDEAQVASAIVDMVKPFAQEIRVTPLGDVLVLKKGSSPAPRKLMICAHMDEVGLIITEIDGQGLLHFTSVGDVDNRVLPGKSVYVNGRIRGVIGGKPVHLMSSEEKAKAIPMEKMTIDIGAISREEAMQVCSVGDYVNFQPEFSLGQNLVRGKALDGRVGCAIAVTLIQSELPYDTWFAFTTRQEVGCVGAGPAAYAVAPDLVIALGGTPAADVLGTSGAKAGCKLGKGPAVSIVDRGTVYDREIVKTAFACAEELGIPCQPRTESSGRTDTSAAHTAGRGARAGAISVPCRYVHGPWVSADIGDIQNTLVLLRALIGQLQELPSWAVDRTAAVL